MLIDSIISFFTKSNHIIKKEDVRKSLEHIFANIEGVVIPTLDETILSANIKGIKDNKLLTVIGKYCGISFKDPKDLFDAYKTMFVTFSNNKKTLFDILEKHLSEVVSDRAISVRDGAIIRVVNDLGSLSIYMMDVLYYSIMDQTNTEFPKIRLKRIESGMSDFAEAYKAYGNPKDFEKILKDLPLVSDSTIDMADVSNTSLLQTMIKKTGNDLKLPSTNGFTNNPFYHIRMWLVDREVDKYESLKDEKKLIQLRILELKLKEQEEGSDPALKKQITYFEEKLNKIDYAIEKIRGDK